MTLLFIVPLIVGGAVVAGLLMLGCQGFTAKGLPFYGRRTLHGPLSRWVGGACIVTAVAFSALLITGCVVQWKNRRAAEAKNLLSEASAYEKRELYEAAIEAFDKYIELDSDNSTVYCGRAHCRTELGDYTNAIRDCNEGLAIASSPRDRAELLVQRGCAHHRFEMHLEAIEDLKAALELAPEIRSASRELAWICAACPDRSYIDAKEVNRWYREMHRLKSRYWDDEELLAALAARDKMFGLATQHQERALNTVLEEYNLSVAAVLQERLDSYSRGVACSGLPAQVEARRRKLVAETLRRKSLAEARGRKPLGPDREEP